MSIQRWKPTDAALIVAGADVEYVTFADHVAAVAAAEQRERERILNDWSLGQMQGNSNGEWILNVVRQKNFERGVKAARDAVKAAYPCRCLQPQPLDGHWGYCPRMEVVPALAAIDAIQSTQNAASGE